MEYKILVNGRPKKTDCHIYKFNYGNVKDIKLTLSEGKLSIELQMKAKKDADEIFTEKNNCFSEAMKKGMLFHLLLYSEPLPEKDIKIYIDDKEIADWNQDKSPLIYSLIADDLNPKLSPKWQTANAVYQYFCKRHKNRQTELAASLYAFLYSKSKDSFTERFLYLWISMNGLYNHLAKMVDPNNRLEYKKITIFEECESWGTGSLTRDIVNRLGKLIDSVFINYGFGTDEFYEALKREISKFPSEKSPFNITLDGYLNLWYPYYLRCNLFHANRPIALFALADEFEIRRLEFVNERLDLYLNDNLWRYFDEEYCEQKIASLPADTR